MKRYSTTSDRSGFSVRTTSNSRLVSSKISNATKEPSNPKLPEWKHTCPCDETKPQDFVSVSVQCLCEEVDSGKELILFFYNTIMEHDMTEDYFFKTDKLSVSYGSSSSTCRLSPTNMHETKHKQHRKDIRKSSHEDRRNTLIGSGGSQLLVKKKQRTSSKSMNREILQVTSTATQPKARRSISANLQSITEDNPMEATNEKSISTTNFEYDWSVKRDEKTAKISFKNGNRYEGEVLDKVPHGVGAFYWADGTVYEGEFEDGCPSGRGRMQLPDSTEYTGMFYKGFFHGNGVYNIRTTNMVYSGNWKYGKKHGSGWLLYEADVWYEGEFRDDSRHGQGFFQFKDKSCYQGQYSKNKRQGRGAMRWSNNDIYIGQWSDGVINGFGEYSWRAEFNDFFCFPVQHHYKGSWVRGKRTGTGIMFFGNENGAKMAGFFQDNFKHGAAVVICGNGKSIEKNPLFYNDKPSHTPTQSNEDVTKADSSSVTFNEQIFQSIIKNGISEKQWPTKNRTSQVAASSETAKQERGGSCSPIEIQIHSPPDDVELYFYIEKASSMYVNAFDTIQFDIDSTESWSSSSVNTSKLQSSKWNSVTLNSFGPSKMNKPSTQDNHCRTSLPQNFSVFNKSESRFQSTVKSEEKYSRNVISRYSPKSIEVYYHYATITSPKKVYFKHYMVRMFSWQSYSDIGITDLGIASVETDKLSDENPASFVESCHHPFEHIYFFQFVQSSMGTALLFHHKSREEVHSSEGSTPYIFQKFSSERVFVHAGSHKGRCSFEYKNISSMKNVYVSYLKSGQPHTARTFSNATCTKKGEDPPCYKAWSEKKCSSVSTTFGQNVNIVGHNFLYLPEKGTIGESTEKSMNIPEDADPFFQDLSAFRVSGPKVVTKCLCSVCPPISKNGIICNMDYSMTFLEFYEVLICCALLAVARNQKKKEFIKNMAERARGFCETDEEMRKSSGKSKKKK